MRVVGGAVTEKQNGHDLAHGELLRRLFAFAMPILAINLMQAVYNITDMIIVGRFIDASGMSAVSVGGQLLVLVFAIVNGLTNGGSAITGRLFGEKRTRDISELAGTQLIFSILLAVMLTMIVIAFTQPLLMLLNTPYESFLQAAEYLRISMLGTVFIYAYHSFYAVLRGIGESVVPMLIMIATTAENIGLDLLLVCAFEGGVAGAAWATVAAQATGAAAMWIYAHKKDLIACKKLRIKWDKLRLLLKIGGPQLCQFFLTNLSFLFIGALVNAYGVDASAAAGAVGKLWGFAMLPGRAMMAALLALTAQCIAVADVARIRRGLRIGAVLASSIGLLITVAAELAPEWLLSLFTDERAVLDAGIGYLRWFAAGFAAENVMFCVFGVIAGTGRTVVNLVCAVVTSFVARYGLAWLLSAQTPFGFEGIAAAYTVAGIVGATLGILYLCFSGVLRIDKRKVQAP